MRPGQLAAGTGIVAAAVTAVLAAVPYAVLDPTAVGPYFTPGLAGPPLVGLFALVTLVVLAAGATGRSDPARMAGTAVVLGAFGAGLAWWWALGVSPSLLGGLTEADWFGNHRWAFGVAATALFAATAGYARAVV